MKMNDHCLPCLVNQIVKVADQTGVRDRETLFRQVFSYLSTLDFSKCNPEIIGDTFRMLKTHTGNDDPYRETRQYYNQLLLEQLDCFQTEINRAEQPFQQAVKYAIVGNLIDFNPVHRSEIAEIRAWLAQVETLPLTIDHTKELLADLEAAKTVLYLGDNCGEICLDRLLIQQIKARYPLVQIYFAVRGKPVVNDVIEADAYQVGMDSYATILSNGDDSLGTVLARTSEDFLRVYEQADVVIAKGQANYESLSEEIKKIYFLLMTKCDVIAGDLGVAQNALICRRHF